MKKQDSIEIHKRLDLLQKLLNGGKGSGNFGHLGRPGKVGGSAAKGSSHADLSSDLSRYLELSKKRELVTKMRRWKSLKHWDDAHEQAMRDVGFSDDDIKGWKFLIANKEIAENDKKEHRKALQQRAKNSPEQKKAIDNVVSKIKVEPKDETWLRNNCSPEMAQAFSDEMDKAIGFGIKEGQIKLRLNDAKSTNGSLGHRSYDDAYNLTISKQILRDEEATKADRRRSGPEGSKWWTSSELNGTFSHEIGHAMVWEALRKACGNDPKIMGFSGGTNIDSYVAGLIVSQARDNLVARGVRGDDLRVNADKKYMSTYGRTNFHESVAESFANPDYSDFTKEIYKVAKNLDLSDKRKSSLDSAIERIKAFN